MKNLFRNPFFVVFLIIVVAFAAIVWGSHFILGLFTDSGNAWLVILGVLLVALVLMQFRRTRLLTPHEAQDELLKILEPRDLRDARLKRENKHEEPLGQ